MADTPRPVSAPPIKAWLAVKVGTDERTFDLPATGECRVGRSSENDLVLDDPTLSRRHCLIQVGNSGAIWLSDRDSANGTFVNGARVTGAVELNDRDEIKIGACRLVLYKSGSAAVSDDFSKSEAGTTRILLQPKLVTVLVMDVRGYTRLSQQVDPGLLAELMGQMNRRATRSLEASGAWSHKFLGDAVMAVWIHENREAAAMDLRKILRSAVDLSRLCDELSATLPDPHKLRIGAGVNTGLAHVGQIGARGALDFTALGEPVNRAFRLESSTKEIGYEIAIGEMSYQILVETHIPPSNFVHREATLKGYDKPVTAYGTSRAVLEALLEGMGAAGSTGG
jgi:adenylate cyclase